MGELLQSYLAANLPALQAIVDEDKPKPSIPPGIKQPGGATTFPMGPQPGPMQGQPIDAGGQPMAPMASMPGPGGINPAAAATPTFAGAPTPGQPQPAMPPVAGQPQDDKSDQFEDGPNSFAAMAKDADDKDVEKAADAMEKSGVDIDAEHAKIVGDTGKGKGKGLSRNEKALILMEFGLNLMASSGTGEGTFASDIGQAGGAALAGHVGRKQASKQAEIDRMEREQKSRLTEAQIKKAETPTTTIKTDKDGNYINISGGVATPILTAGGEPVSAANVEKFNSEVDRQAYEELECVDLSGAALKSCKRRALAYGKGGGARVAFPELERADQTDKVMKNLEDPDKRSAKYHVPSTGQTMRWREMSPAQQDEVATGFVDRRMRIWENPGTDAKAGGIEGLSPEDIARMKPGKIYTLSDDRKAKLVNGVPTIID